MRIRIVQVRVFRSGRRAEEERSLERDTLPIGRGTDNEIQLGGLSVALRHASAVLHDGRVVLRLESPQQTLVNGRIASSDRRLRPGDVIRIGGHELRVLPSRAGEDLALEVEEVLRRQTDLAELWGRTRIGLGGGWLSQRGLAWTLALATGGILLALPLREPSLRASWQTGSLASAHAFFGSECGKCHAEPFERVRNGECFECHAAAGRHVPAETRLAELEGARCAGCHREHEGEVGLAALEERLCAGCHANLTERFATTSVENASDFGTHHPELRLSLAMPGLNDVHRERWYPDLREQSGLAFSHLRHVGRPFSDPKTGEKRTLPCGECHAMDAGGKHMLPIEFETHCAKCHSLEFDEHYPERQAQHGAVSEMRQDLAEFYAGVALRREVRDPEAPEFLRRAAPGKPAFTEPERRAVLAWAASATRQAEAVLMEEEKRCKNCHEIEKSAERGEYNVAPVELARVWMPKSEFRHSTHAPFACRDCHPAAAVYDPEFAPEALRPAWSLESSGGPHVLFSPEELHHELGLEASERSSDVLVPGIETCRSCHAGAGTDAGRVRSDCVLCHPFHRAEHGSMREARP